MLIKLSAKVIYNAASGDWIRYAHNVEEGGEAHLLFSSVGRPSTDHRLTGEDAMTAWAKLCDIAETQDQVLFNQSFYK